MIIPVTANWVAVVPVNSPVWAKAKLILRINTGINKYIFLDKNRDFLDDRVDKKIYGILCIYMY